MDRQHLDWPFFEARHRGLAAKLDAWAAQHLHADHGSIADFCVLFARPGEGDEAGVPRRGSRGISAFIVDAGLPGFEIAERIDVIAPHPLARLRFSACRIPKTQRLGAPGEGFKVAM